MTPAGRFLTAEWRHLVMLNYEIDPAALAGRVPAGCELDAWQGHHMVSVVGFRFLDTRVFGVPVPFHRHFEEVNLRFYVRRKAEDGWRRGVVFVKEIVPRPAIAWVARTVYGEQYVALPMRHAGGLPEPAGPQAGARGAGRSTARLQAESWSIGYEWQRRGAWEGVSATGSGSAAIPAPDAEETFITEHYWGYCRQRDGATVEYQVEHPRWRVWRAESASLDCDPAGLYGAEFAEALAGPPRTAFIADGSPVVVRRGRRLG